jgi:L-lactate permease
MIDYRVSAAVGIVVIATALIFRWRKRMTTFRIMFLVGFIYFIGGMIVWNVLGPWLGIVLAALWFVTAIYFARAERRERRSDAS